MTSFGGGGPWGWGALMTNNNNDNSVNRKGSEWKGKFEGDAKNNKQYMENIETPSYSNIKNKKVYHTFFHSKQSLGLLHTDQAKTFSQNLYKVNVCFYIWVMKKKNIFCKNI